MPLRCFILIVSLGCLLCASASFAGERIAVIVSADNDVELDRQSVARIFLKKQRFWPGRAPIVPVNREADSETRIAFSAQILGQTVRRLEVYWNRQYYHGVLPPLTLASDEAVIRFVGMEPNAIGYVRESRLDDSVRAVLIFESPEPAIR